MRGAGFGEGGEAVAVFEGGDDAAFGVAVGDRDDLLGEPGVVGGVDVEAAERVEAVGPAMLAGARVIL